MRTLKEIVAEAMAANVRLDVNVEGLARASGTVAEGLFQVPLLAITILVVTKSRKNLATSEMATWALGTLVKHFEDLRLARARIQWSVVLRRRCADALIFLENAELVSVREHPDRRATISANGRAFLQKLSKNDQESGFLVRGLARAQRAVDQTGLELL